MIRSVLLLAALALSACDTSTLSASNDACARIATHEVTWTDEGAPDVITARADGPTCTQAALTLVVRDASGDPLWVFASTHYDMTAGGIAPEGAPAVSNQDMNAFLEGWADVTTMRSSELPEWRGGLATLTESATTFSYDTPFDRETYEGLRSRDLAMICYAAAVAATQCLLIDPASHAPTMIVAYGS